MGLGSAVSDCADIGHERRKSERDGNGAQTLFVGQGVHAVVRLMSCRKTQFSRFLNLKFSEIIIQIFLENSEMGVFLQLQRSSSPARRIARPLQGVVMRVGIYRISILSFCNESHLIVACNIVTQYLYCR